MVVVFGSINLDLVTRVQRFPAPGETLSGLDFAVHAGGKGANQALAAKRAGADVRMFGAVGRDAFAPAATALLEAGGVDLRGLAAVDAATGCATIIVDAQGENCIVVVAGANANVDAQAVPDAALKRDCLLVLQQEVPAAANAILMARAQYGGARILLNAAPARPLPLDLLRQLDLLVVNESEATALAGAHDMPAAPNEFAAALAKRVPGLSVIVTLGAAGALWCNGAAALHVAAPEVDVVDATGAGDAFVGTLAAALDAGAEREDALRRAVAAGSLACTVRGAQPALPHRAAIDALLPLVALVRN